MRAQLLLRLGRVSNLPTVCSNVLTGTVLSGTHPSAAVLLGLMAAMALSYEGGMFLNDAFDHRWDAQHRPERPIPLGLISARTVFSIGFGLLAAGVITTCLLSAVGDQPSFWAPAFALLLAANIVVYDLWHKGNPLGPVLMGGCRVLVYLTVLYALGGSFDTRAALAVVALLGYLMGLSYVARQESLRELTQLWPLPLLAAPLFVAVPFELDLQAVSFVLLLGWIVYCLRLLFHPAKRDIPGAVGFLIAGISLVDALLVAKESPGYVAWCLLAFALTLLLQRKIAGT